MNDTTIPPAAPYRSTTSLAELAAWLRDCRRIVVLTHIKPDGDAVGSTLAITRALNLSNPFAPGPKPPPRAEAWYYGPKPPWFEEVVRSSPHRFITADGPPPAADPDAVLIVDTGSWHQVEPVADWIRRRADCTAVIDHHVQGDPDIAPLRVIDTAAAAACQPAAELCRLLLNAPSLAALPAEVATPLYLGLATDTGWFRHSNVNKTVMTTAGELISAGAESVRLYQVIEQQDSPGRLRLLSRALASLEIAEIGRSSRGPAHIAVMSLSKRDFAETGAEAGESGGFVDYTQAIASVRVTALLTEASPGDAKATTTPAQVLTKISLRSKNPLDATDVDIDVNAVAKSMGGGGHVRAAGARLNADIPSTRAAIVDAIRAAARAQKDA